MLAPLRCNFQRLSQVTVYSQHLRHARRPFKRLGLPANGLHATMAPPRSKLQFVDASEEKATHFGMHANSWHAEGVQKIIITAGSLPESRAALQLAQTDERLYCTLGVHPTRCQEIEDSPDGPEGYWNSLKALLKDSLASGKVVAIGECGLDYDRLQFCSKEVQQKWFKRHFELAASCQLPMFLHLRAAATDFLAILKQHSPDFTRGVVHSFDDSQEVLTQLLAYANISIGINGCSLKTAENLAVMATIPADRLLLETDSPYCEIRPSHAGKSHVKTVYQAKDKKKHDEEMLVKGRNEPCNIASVFEAVSGHRQVSDLEQFADQIYSNTMQMYFAE